jgi:hypothetical protein
MEKLKGNAGHGTSVDLSEALEAGARNVRGGREVQEHLKLCDMGVCEALSGCPHPRTLPQPAGFAVWIFDLIKQHSAVSGNDRIFGPTVITFYRGLRRSLLDSLQFG